MSLKSSIGSQLNIRSLIKAGVYVVILASVLTIGIIQRSSALHAYRLATSHSPETYTELYFNESTKLPTTVTAGRSYSYSVHVANHELTAYTYILVATITVPNQLPTTSESSFTMAPGTSSDTTFNFSLSHVHQTATITVALKNQQQLIEFRSQS
jgi:uncharacterized membrane protein